MAINPEDNISKQILSFPYDKNRKPASILVLPIVDPGSKEIIGYLPAKARDNGDGTATLEVDTELTLNGDVIIDNIRIASINGIDANKLLLVDSVTGALKVDVVAGVTSGVVEHHNGTANIAVATVTFSGITRHAQIQNMSASRDILVSFDGGANFRTIEPATTLDIDGKMTDLAIKATADGAPYEILALV